MAEQREVETKYDVPVEFTVPDLADTDGVVAVDEPVEHHLDATYYDTPDLRLARNHVTLRRRTGGNDAGWHLKTPAGDRARTERQVPLDTEHAGSGSVPATIADEVRDLTGNNALRPIARIRTRRVERPLRGADGSVLALLADDTVSGEPLDRPATLKRWRELEVELVGGKPRVLDAIDSKLRSAGARRSSSRSKLARALGDRLAKRAPKRQNRPSRNGGRPSRTGGRPSRTGGRPSRTGAAEALARYLRAQRDAIHSTAPGVRSGDVDAVHDMRVATRRLRSTLRSFKPFIDPAFLPLIGELKWLADRLGAVRDGDVMGNRLSKAVAAVPAAMVIGPVAAMVAKRLADQRDGDRAALIEAMDSPRYVALLEAVDRLIESPPAKKVTPRRLRRQVRKALKRADRRLAAARNAGNAGNAKPAKKGKQRKATSNGRNRHGTSPSRDELLHASRRAYKRARYAVEVLADSDRKPAKRLVKRLTALQDVLGDHQDSIVIAKRLKDLSRQASDAGESAFTYGALHVLQKRAATRSLKGLRRARRRVAKRPIRRFLQK